MTCGSSEDEMFYVEAHLEKSTILEKNSTKDDELIRTLWCITTKILLKYIEYFIRFLRFSAYRPVILILNIHLSHPGCLARRASRFCKKQE